MAKKNSEWAKQLTPDQLNRFKENFVNERSDKSVVDYLELNTSESFTSFILGGITWDKSNEGFEYWDMIADGKTPEEPEKEITKPIEEIAETDLKDKSLAKNNDLVMKTEFVPFQTKLLDNKLYQIPQTPEQTEAEMRDKIALEAMKSMLDAAPVANVPKFAGRCYEIADAMLEARKPKITAP